MNKFCNLLILAVATFGLSACGIDRGGAPLDPPVTSIVNNDAIVGQILARDASSLTVDGQRIDVSNASFALNGAAADLSMFSPGMQVSVAGTIADDGTATALSVAAQLSVAGPLERFDPTTGDFDILATTIRTDATTQFTGGTAPGSAPIATPFAVSGYCDANGNVLATFVGAHNTPGVRRSGFASNVDASNMTLRIGTTDVDYSQAAVVSFANAAPSDGERLTISASAATSGTLVAATIESTPLLSPGVGDHSTIQISGFVTAFTTATDFEIAHQRAQLAPTAVVTGGTSTDLNTGRLILLHGELDGQQRIVAARLTFLD